jgi:hypothetical protein
MQKPLLENMHALSFNDTSNIQHYTHTPTVQQVQKSVNKYQGQTNMVSSANYYGTPHTSNFTNIQQGVSSIYSSAVNSQYVITSQNLPVNEKVVMLILAILPAILKHHVPPISIIFSKVEMNQF